MKAPLIIDVEASGLGRGSYPIEVGVALPNGDTHCMLIRREDDWLHWDDEAEGLHGISRESLQKHGRNVVDAALHLNEWLAGELVYTDAWGNDSSWLAQLFEYAGISQQFKLESLRTLLSDKQLQCWHPVKERITAECGFQRHRASNDAVILQRTFCQTAALAGDDITVSP